MGRPSTTCSTRKNPNLMRTTLDFLLYDWLNVENLTECERYAEHSRETFDSVLDTSARIARERFAPFNRLVDLEEPQFDGERVHLPRETGEAVAAYAQAGLLAAGHDYGHGGMQLPYVIDMAANSFFAMASIGLSAYGMLTYANCNLLLAHGTQAQIRAFASPEMEGRFFGTMCLSEPQAGSSLGDIQTRALPDAGAYEADPLGPRYRIFGSKMWISGGEHDLSENIVHLVLAKVPGADGAMRAGVKGISLFAVPRELVDGDGRCTGRRNDIALAGLNHKLGYRGTVNTLLNFGEGRFPVGGEEGTDTGNGAIGYLIGKQGEGLTYMFHMMNEARINVGMGASMLAYAGYLASLDYAQNRPQGRPYGRAGKDPSIAPVPIIQHADVKRMLLAQKTYAEGGLALGLYCARLVDLKNTGGPRERADAERLLQVLTPIAKSWPSEWGLEANNLAIQVLGGAGYTRDFPVEQYWRDNRLNMIHEGTHGIQGLDLLGRKVAADSGADFKLLVERIEATIVAARSHTELSDFGLALEQSLIDLTEATTAALTDVSAEVGLANATLYLQGFGHTVMAWIWLDIAAAAITCAKQDGSRDSDFYQGKLQAARYFFRYELPKVEAWLRPCVTHDDTCLRMQETWF